MATTKTQRVEFVIGARDESKAVVARARANVKAELAALDKESAKFRTTGGMSIADRQGLTAGRKGSDLGAERDQIAAAKRARRQELAGISDEEDMVRRAMNAKVAEMDRAAVAERVKAEANRRLFGAEEVKAAEEIGRKSGAAKAKGEAAAEGEGRLRSLKKLLGEDSTAGLLAKSLLGAGALSAVGLVTSKAAEATTRIRELGTEFRQGKISAGEMADQIARAVPILGDIWTIGRNIREGFTHEEENAAKLLAVDKMRNQMMDGRIASLKRVKEINAEIEEIERRGLARVGILNAAGAARDRLNMQEEHRQQLGEISDKRKDLTAGQEQRAKEAADVGKKIDDIKARTGYGSGVAVQMSQADMDELNLLEKKRKELRGTDAETLAKQQSLDREEVVLRKTQAAEMEALERDIAKASGESRRQSNEELIAADREAYKQRLEAAGEFYKAKMAEINFAYSDEIAAAQEKYKQEREAGFTAADQNYRDAIAAAQMRGRTATAAAALDEQKRQEDARRSEEAAGNTPAAARAASRETPQSYQSAGDQPARKSDNAQPKASQPDVKQFAEAIASAFKPLLTRLDDLRGILRATENLDKKLNVFHLPGY